MRKRTEYSAILTLCLAVPAQAGESLPGDETQVIAPEELEFLVNECTACHGENGISHREEIPSLAGKTAEEILAAVEQFYFFERHCPDVEYRSAAPRSGAHNMCDVAERLTRQEVLAIGAHFETLPPPPDG